MSLYLITLNQDTPDGWAALKSRWPDHHYILTPRVAFVADSSMMLVDTLAETLGMNPTDEVLGLVVEVGRVYQGYNIESLWEWIDKAEHAHQGHQR